jgi:hypothetical protein
MAEVLQKNLFVLFECFRKSQDKDFDSFAKNALSQIDWGEEEFLETHYYSIAIRIYEEIERREGSVKLHKAEEN